MSDRGASETPGRLFVPVEANCAYMRAFGDVAVGIPTLHQRASILEQTLADWQRFNVAPLVHMQAPDLPLNDISQRHNGDRTLRSLLETRPEAAYILLTEDDIILGQDFPLWVSALKLLNAPATFFLNGVRHYPDTVRLRLRENERLPERIVRVRALRDWWGSQAILLPRAVAEDVERWESSHHGWDMHLKEYLLVRGISLYTPVPNPVQHRVVESTHHPGTPSPHSATFGRPSDGGGISPPPGIDWCPHRLWEPDPRSI